MDYSQVDINVSSWPKWFVTHWTRKEPLIFVNLKNVNIQSVFCPKWLATDRAKMVSFIFMNRSDVSFQGLLKLKSLLTNVAFKVPHIFMDSFDVHGHVGFSSKRLLANRTLEILDLFMNKFDVFCKVTLCKETFAAHVALVVSRIFMNPSQVAVQNASQSKGLVTKWALNVFNLVVWKQHVLREQIFFVKLFAADRAREVLTFFVNRFDMSSQHFSKRKRFATNWTFKFLLTLVAGCDVTL